MAGVTCEAVAEREDEGVEGGLDAAGTEHFDVTGVDAVEGFGILSMASIGPIISVLTVGLWVQWKVNRKHRRYDESHKVDTSIEQVGTLASDN